MIGSLTAFRAIQLCRVLVVVFVVLSFVGGMGIAQASPVENNGRNCPGDNPTQAFERASGTGVENSAKGRVIALEATDCLP